MASTIAAITTGVGGVVTTADATGNLSLLSGTTTVVAVTSTGATVTGTLAVSGVTTLTGGLNAALPVLSGGTGVTTSTGTGNNVLSTSPNLTTPVLGTVTSGNISACTSTNMVLVTPTFDSASLVTISGTAPLYMCRAWVNFNGTGTVAIRGSGNVSSITDRGVGRYSVNLTTAMPDANYSVVVSASKNDNNEDSYVSTATGTSTTIQTSSIAYISTAAANVYPNDCPQVNVSIFR